MKKFKVEKTYRDINAKIKSGKAVVVTAEEMIGMVREAGPVEAARHVDVVTTGTFAPMCSSGAFINFGHTQPGIKASKVWLNNVPAYGGVAAVDCYIGATDLRRRSSEQGLSRRIQIRRRACDPGSGGRQKSAS